MKLTESVRSFQTPPTPFTRLTAEFAFRADFARHARHFRSERVELVHHRIDGVLQLQNFAADIHRDLAGQIAVGHGRRHFRDVTNLSGEVRRHEVHRIRQILPGARNALHLRLSAELAFRTHFARHARDFRRERVQLIHHRVHHLGGAHEFALERPAIDFERHLLRQIALCHSADDASDLGRGLHQVGDQAVYVVDHRRPCAAHVAEVRALIDLSFFTDGAADALQLDRHPLIQLDYLVERVVNLSRHTGLIGRAVWYEKSPFLIAVSVLRSSRESTASTGGAVAVAFFIEGIDPSVDTSNGRYVTQLSVTAS